MKKIQEYSRTSISLMMYGIVDWFGMLLFEQWFLDILLPHVKVNIQYGKQITVIRDRLQKIILI